MKLTGLLQAVRVTALLPALAMTTLATLCAPAAQSNPLNKLTLTEELTVAELAFHEARRHERAAQLSPLQERTFSQSLESVETHLSPSEIYNNLDYELQRLPNNTSSEKGPNEPPTGPLSEQRTGSNRRERNSNNNQTSDRLRERLWIESIRSTLEVNVRSDSLQSLDISDEEEAEKESFGFVLERPLQRSRRSEFSWSLGFDYRDESLTPPANPALGFSLPPLPENFAGPPPSSPNASPPTSAPPSSPSGPPNPPPRTSSPSTTRPSSTPPNNPPPNNPPPNNPPPNNLPPNNPTTGNAPVPGSTRNEPPPVTAADESFIAPTISPVSGATDAEMRTGIVKFAQNYRRRDRSGQWSARSQFNLGTELTESPENMGADAQFFSWVGRVERAQAMGNDHRLTLKLETQLSPSSLLPMHQFKMEDRRFTAFSRDSRPANISGNNGVRLYLEDRMVLMRSRTQAPVLSFIPFVDAGYIWGQSNSRNPNQQFLGRTGVGLLIEPLPGLDIQLDYLTHWGDLGEDADAQNQYITITYETEW